MRREFKDPRAKSKIAPVTKDRRNQVVIARNLNEERSANMGILWAVRAQRRVPLFVPWKISSIH